MQQFYEEENYALLSDNPDKEFLLDAIKEVGQKATEGANSILDEIKDKLSDKIPGSYKFNAVKTAPWNWARRFRVWPSQSHLLNRERMLQIGVFIDAGKGNFFHPWVWVRGGRARLEELRIMLGVGNVDKDALYLPVPTKFNLSDAVDVEMESIVNGVVKSFNPFIAKVGDVWKAAKSS
jgi:hypothetical protein